jgi:excisionase family DNA binding protein
MGEKNLERYLSLDEASAFLGGMSTSTISEKVRNGVLPAYKPGKHLLFDVRDLREFVKRHRVGK